MQLQQLAIRLQLVSFRAVTDDNARHLYYLKIMYLYYLKIMYVACLKRLPNVFSRKAIYPQ